VAERWLMSRRSHVLRLRNDTSSTYAVETELSFVRSDDGGQTLFRGLPGCRGRRGDTSNRTDLYGATTSPPFRVRARRGRCRFSPLRRADALSPQAH
jgi:hypothetical protein